MPEIRKGDILLIDPDRIPKAGDMVALYEAARIAEYVGEPSVRTSSWAKVSWMEFPIKVDFVRVRTHVGDHRHELRWHNRTDRWTEEEWSGEIDNLKLLDSKDISAADLSAKLRALADVLS